MVAFEHPLPGPVAEGPRRLVGLEPVERGVVGQIEDASADAGASTGEDVAANVDEASGPQDDGPTVRQ